MHLAPFLTLAPQIRLLLRIVLVYVLHLLTYLLANLLAKHWSTNANRTVVAATSGRSTVNGRQPSLCDCGSTHLEYSAN